MSGGTASHANPGSRPQVLAIVLNWNGGEQTLKCLAHLAAQRPIAPDILVVDNASTDGSTERLGREGAPWRLQVLEKNFGFAEGMNVGMRVALSKGYPYVWLVNNDAFPEPSCLSLLLETMTRDASLGLVTPKLLSIDGSEQQAGGFLNLFTGELGYCLSAAMDVSESRTLSYGAWITGTAPLMRTDALRAVGLFDASFFAYWEDVDLSLRLTRGGAHIGAVPAARTLHLGGSTSGGEGSPFVSYLDTRNRWLCLERNANIGSSRARWLRYLGIAIRRAARYRLRGRPEFQTAILAGVTAARRGTPVTPGAPFTPGVVERLLSRNPWRVSNWLMDLAGWLEPQHQSSPRFPFADE